MGTLGQGRIGSTSLLFDRITDMLTSLRSAVPGRFEKHGLYTSCAPSHHHTAKTITTTTIET
eukprot:3686035-Amphidinium_carterae.1